MLLGWTNFINIIKLQTYWLCILDLHVGKVCGEVKKNILSISYICAVPDECLLKSIPITTDLKRNSSGRTRRYEYSPLPLLTLYSVYKKKLYLGSYDYFELMIRKNKRSCTH